MNGKVINLVVASEVMIYLQILGGIIGYLVLGVTTMCFYAYVVELTVDHPDDKVLVVVGIFLWPIFCIVALLVSLCKFLGGFIPKISPVGLVNWFGSRKSQKKILK